MIYISSFDKKIIGILASESIRWLLERHENHSDRTVAKPERVLREVQAYDRPSRRILVFDYRVNASAIPAGRVSHDDEIRGRETKRGQGNYNQQK